MTLHSLLHAFHDTILRNDAASFLHRIRPNPKLPPEKQMAIYTEGYRSRLLEAIRSDYPETIALLGDAAFDACALRYIESTPPAHFSLDHYPHPFAAFVRAEHGPCLLSDVAVLEGAIAEVFLMPDSLPLTPAALAGLTPEAFGDLVLYPRFASRILQLDYPAGLYVRESREGRANPATTAETTRLYLVRHDNEVRRHTLTHAQYLLLGELCRQSPVGTALETIAEAHPECLSEIATSLQPWFAAWTSSGFFQSPEFSPL